jgi:hypothetical protein
MVRKCKLDVSEILKSQTDTIEHVVELEKQLLNPIEHKGNIVQNIKLSCEEELEKCKEDLTAIGLDEVKIPYQVIMVRLKSSVLTVDMRFEQIALIPEQCYLLLGEIAQKPGNVAIQDLTNGQVIVISSAYLEIIPPHLCD